MKTKQFIDRVVRVCQSVPRSLIIEETNNALDILFDRPLAIMRVYNASTGLDPVLSTMAGTYQYTSGDLNTTENIAYLGRVYSDPLDKDGGTDVIVDHNNRVLHGESITINFSEDPGTANYYVETYKKPTYILSENSPVYIPFPDEFITKYLFELVVGNIELMSHGQSSRLEKFESEKLFDLYGKLNETTPIVKFSSYRY
jgi:hypothetical protein